MEKEAILAVKDLSVGLMLVIIVLLFDKLGENMKKIIDPYSSHE